jgi:hypothetical protein
MMAAEPRSQSEDVSPGTIPIPAPTASPIVLAFGLLLLFAGMATSAAISVLGAVATIAGMIGWFRHVLPREAHGSVREEPPPPPAATSRSNVVRLHVVRDSRRARLPVEIYPVSAGIKGGLAGGLAMAVLAALYGALSGHGIWYPINLLSAGFFPGTITATTAELNEFQLASFVVACAIHLAASVGVGLLYGAMLPMLPRRPVVLAGLAAPILWSGLLHSIIGIINPVLNQRVDWFWFVISQVGFGIVAGIVVSKQERVRTWQGLPLAIRAGLEASGLHDEPGPEEGER